MEACDVTAGISAIKPGRMLCGRQQAVLRPCGKGIRHLSRRQTMPFRVLSFTACNSGSSVWYWLPEPSL